MTCSVRGCRFATPRCGGRGNREWLHSIASPRVPISPPFTHMIYLLLFLSYLAGFESFSPRPHARPTRIRWQAIASSSGNYKVTALAKWLLRHTLTMLCTDKAAGYQDAKLVDRLLDIRGQMTPHFNSIPIHSRGQWAKMSAMLHRRK